MTSDWSGMISANSLPQEVRSRLARNMMLVESAARTPNNIPVGESRYGQPRGFYSEARQLVGGAASVSVDTLSWTKTFPPSSSTGLILGQDLTDPYYGMTKNQYNRTKFNEAFGQMVRGGYRIREAGPKSGFAPGFPDISAVGTYYSGDFPHQPDRRSGGRRRGYTDDGNPLRRAEEEARLHDGDCGSVHPYQTHRDWASSEEEEERHRMKSKYFETLRIAERRGELPAWARP